MTSLGMKSSFKTVCLFAAIFISFLYVICVCPSTGMLENQQQALYIITEGNRHCSQPSAHNQPQWACSHLTGS